MTVKNSGGTTNVSSRRVETARARACFAKRNGHIAHTLTNSLVNARTLGTEYILSRVSLRFAFQ